MPKSGLSVTERKSHSQWYFKLQIPVAIVLFLLVVYILLTDYSGANDKTTSSMTESENDTETCPVRDITINDGLCDDKANIKACQFDGDDCCLELKPKVLCSYCQCKLGDVNMDRLKLIRRRHWANITVTENSFPLVKTIDNVQNDLTCLHRCSNDSNIDSNAWALERLDHLNCKCYEIPSVFCPQMITNVSAMDGNLIQINYNKEQVCRSVSNGNEGQDETTITSELQGLTNSTKILIATGSLELYVPMELVSFNGDHVSVCETRLTLTEEVLQGTGGLLHDHENNPVFLICGGTLHNSLGKNPPNDKCLDIFTRQQISFNSGKMKSHSASLVINNKLWVTGGDIFSMDIKNSAETILIGPDSFQQGPDLPVPNTKHCLAHHGQEKQIYLLGGHTSPINVWSIHSWAVENHLENWRPEPFLSKGRSMSSCGVIADTDDPTIFYVVIAGADEYDVVDEGRGTEFMKIGNGYFQTGPRLPYHLRRAASVALDDALVLFGGSSNEHYLSNYLTSIFLFQCHYGDCHLTLLHQEIIHRRHSCVASLIPSNLVECR